MHSVLFTVYSALFVLQIALLSVLGFILHSLKSILKWKKQHKFLFTFTINKTID